METVATGNNEQDFAELEAHTTRIKELAANMIKQQNCLIEELKAKKEDIASFTASLENNNKEIAELRKQIEQLQIQEDEIKATNEKNQTLIVELRSLVAEQEMQLKDQKEVIGIKEQVITSFAVSLENSKKEIVELHKKLDEMKVTNEKNQTLIVEYQEKNDSLSKIVPVVTNRQSEPKAKEENSVQKEDLKSQKKKLKKLLKEHPKANEKELAQLLGVESSYIIRLRKEFDI